MRPLVLFRIQTLAQYCVYENGVMGLMRHDGRHFLFLFTFRRYADYYAIGLFQVTVLSVPIHGMAFGRAYASTREVARLAFEIVFDCFVFSLHGLYNLIQTNDHG